MPDPARADDAGGLAVEVEALKPREREVVLPDPTMAQWSLRFKARISGTMCSATEYGE